MGNTKEVDTRFGRFGTISFTATTRVNDFINYLEQDSVAGTRCQSCGQQFFPPRADCCCCFSSDMAWFCLEEPGRLATFSTLQYGPRGFENDLPYTVGVLEFGAYRVFGRIAKRMDPDALHVGMSMVVRALRLDSGQLSYEFIQSADCL